MSKGRLPLIWILNLAAVVVIYGVLKFFEFAGWQFAVGFSAGYFFCYMAFKCWKSEHKDDNVIDQSRP